MRNDTRVPVLVGVGTASQREDDPTVAVEAVELMRRAGEAALDDTGAAGIRDRVDWIGVPEGTWSYRDPGRLLAGQLGCRDAPSVHTTVAGVGILQQDLFNMACAAVTRRGAGVALVAGGEAKYRALRAAITGVDAGETEQHDDERPDVVVKPSSLGVSDLEIIRNTATPIAAYALIENAIGHRLGRSVDEHRDRVAALWARFAAVARDNPDAWDRGAYRAAQIRDADAATGNRMISFPYTKRHSAQWNVDQAAALLFCSLHTARELGIPEDRWVFPHVSVVSNHAVHLTERREVDRCPGADLAASRTLQLAGRAVDQLDDLDLYSCFPAAVEVFAAALGVDADAVTRPLTVTGGLAFAGGPLNNYVLQALVELARRLRGRPERAGLSSSVSGFLVKQGFSIWSAHPPERGFVVQDVADEVAKVTPTVDVVDHAGSGTIASWTIDYADGVPSRSVALVDLDGGVRTIASTTEPDVAEALLQADPIGSRVGVRDDGTFRPT